MLWSNPLFVQHKRACANAVIGVHYPGALIDIHHARVRTNMRVWVVAMSQAYIDARRGWVQRFEVQP